MGVRRTVRGIKPTSNESKESARACFYRLLLWHWPPMASPMTTLNMSPMMMRYDTRVKYLGTRQAPCNAASMAATSPSLSVGSPRHASHVPRDRMGQAYVWRTDRNRTKPLSFSLAYERENNPPERTSPPFPTNTRTLTGSWRPGG